MISKTELGKLAGVNNDLGLGCLTPL